MKNYRNIVRGLEKHVAKFCNLSYADNPIIRRLDYLSKKEIEWVIKEYSQFSNEAIHMLLDARIRVHEWTELAKEIDRNIEEEKGSKTDGVPHLEIMRKGYLSGIDFDVNDYQSSEATKILLTFLKRIFRKKENAYLAGALLAFESVSISEFYVLDALVSKRKAYNNYLCAYIDGHKHFEIGHKEGLMKAIEQYIGPEERVAFSDGYLHVCGTLSRWWDGLSNSIFKKDEE